MKLLIMKFTFAVIVSSALAGCGMTASQYAIEAVLASDIALSFRDSTVSQYGTSVKNVTAVQNSGLKPVAVSSVASTTPGLSAISCRVFSGVETPDGSTYESYIQKAITDELQLAGLYDPASPIVLQGKIERMDLNSILYAGKWVISLNLASNVNAGYTTTIVYESPTNFVGDLACQQVAQAFFPAVRTLLLKTVSDPRFKELSKQEELAFTGEGPRS